MTTAGRLERARAAAESVVDPELPMLTLGDLGVLRDVTLDGDTVVVHITPTYTGCPAMATMRADLLLALRRTGFDRVEVRTVLEPAWTTDWITDVGRASLRAHGIAPPGPAGTVTGPVPLTLTAAPQRVACPQCGSWRTREVSRFGSSACKSVHQCLDCAETFDRIKEL